jgi:osmotically-inducible protein OsmY
MAQSDMNRDLNRGDGDGRERPQYRSRSDRTHSTQNFENENAFRFNRGKEGDQDWKTGDYTDDDYRFDNSQHVNYGERYGSAAYGRAHYDPGMNRDFVDPRDAERQSSSESWRSDRPFTNREQDYRGRGPKNYSRTDERIRDEVCERLTEAHDVDPSEVEVVVASGEVTLRGTISDRSMKRRAERLAESVMGVQDVHNELRLGKSQGSESSEVATTSSRSGGGKPAKSPNSPM